MPKDRSSTESSVSIDKPLTSSFYNPLAQFSLNACTAYLRDQLRKIESPRAINGLQGVADFTNLYFTSCCNLYFLYRDALFQRSDMLDPAAYQASYKEFHDFESTTDGFALTLGLGILMVGFGFIGSYFDENDKSQPPFIQWITYLLSFARLGLKQIKWVFKSIRYLLTILARWFVGHNTLLVQLLFPLAILASIVAVINSIILKESREQRKVLQRENMKFSKDIITYRSLVHDLETKPEHYTLYHGSFIFVGSGDQKRLYYINSLGGEEELEYAADDYAALQGFCGENVHEIMSYRLKDIKAAPSEQMSEQTEKTLNLNFYDGSLDEVVLDPLYRESYVYLTGSAYAANARLYYVDKDGKCILDKDSVEFYKAYEDVAKRQTIATISQEQLLTLDCVKQFKQSRNENKDLPAFQLGSDYQSLLAFTKTREIHAWEDGQNNWAIYQAAATGFFDGLYFYGGMVTLALFMPVMYVSLLVISIGLLAACIAVRVHEEKNIFQNRHRLTCIQPKLEQAKTAYALLEAQLDALLKEDDKKPLSDPDLEEKFKTLEDAVKSRLQLRHLPTVPSDETPRNKMLWLLRYELSVHFTDILACKEEQKEIIKGSMSTALLSGLYNGLSIQGMISSFMFLMATLLYTPMACPPLFILVCVSAGLAALVVSCAIAWWQYTDFRKKFDEIDTKNTKEYQPFMDAFDKVAKDKDVLDEVLTKQMSETLASLNARWFEQVNDPMIVEYGEMGRLLNVGLMKGFKGFKELFFNLFNRCGLSDLMPGVEGLGALIFAGAYVLRYALKTILPEQTNFLDVMETRQDVPAYRYMDRNRLFKEKKLDPKDGIECYTEGLDSTNTGRMSRQFSSDEIENQRMSPIPNSTLSSAFSFPALA